MTTEKMNIHKALCELKIIDDRILTGVSACKFVGVTKKIAQMVGSEKVENFSANERSKYDSVVDLIKRRAAIKRAVVLSNAVTKVVIAGTEYTVAEAIEMKNHGLDGKKLLREAIASSLKRAEYNIEVANVDAEKKADMHVQGLNGKDIKADEIVAARNGFLEAMAVELVDPLNARKKLADLDEEIAAFMTEVDSALSTSNSLTEIEISY